jgi:hypothetical protein
MSHGVAVRIAVLALVAGCVVSAPAQARHAFGDPKEAFTKPDQAWAKRVVLHRDELPTGVRWRTFGAGGSNGSGGSVPARRISRPAPVVLWAAAHLASARVVGGSGSSGGCTHRGKPLRSFVDMGWGQRGRAVSWLILHGAYTPIPAPVEAQLVRLVTARMEHGP